MKRFAAHIILVLCIFIFTSSAPLWQVRVPVRETSTRYIAERLVGVDSMSPSSPVKLTTGKIIYNSSCSGCHGTGMKELGKGMGSDYRPLRDYSPRDIHQLITWGHSMNLPMHYSWTGKRFESDTGHPAYPASLDDGERWAVAIYVISMMLDTSSEPQSFHQWTTRWIDNMESRHLSETTPEKYGRLCAQCHGSMGYGNGHLSRDLAPPPRNLRDTIWLASQSDRHIFETIRDGKKSDREKQAGSPVTYWSGMPWWGDYLSDMQIRALVNYVRSFSYTLEEPVIEDMGSIDMDNELIPPDANIIEWKKVEQLLPDAPLTRPGWYQQDE